VFACLFCHYYISFNIASFLNYLTAKDQSDKLRVSNSDNANYLSLSLSVSIWARLSVTRTNVVLIDSLLSIIVTLSDFWIRREKLVRQ